MRKLNIVVNLDKSYKWDEIILLCKYNKIKLKSIAKYLPYDDIEYQGKYLNSILILFDNKSLMKLCHVLKYVNASFRDAKTPRLSRQNLIDELVTFEIQGIGKKNIYYYTREDIDKFITSYLAIRSYCTLKEMLNSLEAKNLGLKRYSLRQYVKNFRILGLIKQPPKGYLYKRDLPVFWKMITKIKG